MTDDHRHDEIRELLLPYALGELDPADRARVERELDADVELRRELELFEAVGARVVSGIELTPAPPAMKGRVMAAVRAGADRPPVAEPVAAPASAAEPRRIGTARSERRRRWFAGPAFAGSLAAACLVLAVVAIDLGRDLDAAERRAERLERSASEGDGPPPGFGGAEPFAVATSGNFKSATGSLIKVSETKWILAVEDVPSPGLGHSWQVWTADSNGIVRNVAQWVSGGTQLIVLDSPDITEVMVSFEPTTRPAPSPSLPPVADVKV